MKTDLFPVQKTFLREETAELLRGGFAPVVTLLREFHFDKAGILLEGMPFSAWSVLEHMRSRQGLLLQFMRNPEKVKDLWPEPWWPADPVPENEGVWNAAIESFDHDLKEIISRVADQQTNLVRPQHNGKTLLWAATSVIQHNAYHIGQIKTIGRQLGVW